MGLVCENCLVQIKMCIYTIILLTCHQVEIPPLLNDVKYGIACESLVLCDMRVQYELLPPRLSCTISAIGS